MLNPLVVALRMEDDDSRADLVQYLINRCQRLEDAIVYHHTHVAGFFEINMIAEEIMRGKK